jgi:hypothetical protein
MPARPFRHDRQNKPQLAKASRFIEKLSLPQDSALTAPRPETESQPESWRAKFHRNFWLSFKSYCQPGAKCDTQESKLSDAQGQYFFWEPVNNDIPEMGLSQP